MTAMKDAATYNGIVTLKDDTIVTIRAIRPDDKARLAGAFRNLEPESIYSRFFYQKKTLTDAEPKSLTEVDFENEVDYRKFSPLTKSTYRLSRVQSANWIAFL
jgi:hypothetical protein